MSQRIEKGAPRFKPGMGAGGPPKRKQLGTPGGRPPAVPPPRASSSGAMSPPPPPSSTASSSKQPPTRSYALATPSHSTGLGQQRTSATPGPSGAPAFKAPQLKPRNSTSTTSATTAAALTARPRPTPTPTPSVVDDDAAAGSSATPIESETPRPRSAFAPGSSSMFAPRPKAPAAIARPTAAQSPPPPPRPAAQRQASSPPRRQASTTIQPPTQPQPQPLASSSAHQLQSPPRAQASPPAPRKPMRVQPTPMAAPQPVNRAEALAAAAAALADGSAGPSTYANEFSPAAAGPSSRPATTSAARKGKSTTSAELSSSSSSTATPFPTKPHTAYFLFQAERRPSLRALHPQASVGELAKLMGAEWKALPETERERWKSLREERMAKYEEEVEAWARANPEQAEARKVTAKKTTSRPTSLLPEGVRPLPKKAPTAYFVFAQEFRTKEREERERRQAEEEQEAESSTAKGKKRARSNKGPTAKEIGDKWRDLPQEERKFYLQTSRERRNQYKEALAAWRSDYPEVAAQLGFQSDNEGDDDDDGEESEVSEGGTRRVRKKRRTGAVKTKRTISDDEREYAALVAEHGAKLEGARLDATSTSMADIAGDGMARRGRASDRTFELDRIRQAQLKEVEQARESNKKELQKQRTSLADKLKRAREGERVELPTREEAARRRKMLEDEIEEETRGDEDEEDVEHELGGRPQDRRRQAEAFEGVGDLDGGTGAASDREGGDNEDEEEIEELYGGGGGGSSGRGGGAAQSDAASDAGTATTMGTYHSLRDNQQAPQMRIVDGQIVVDQSSLSVQRNEETVFEEADMVEEVAGHRFVNSATHSKRGRAGVNSSGKATAASKAAAAAAVAKWDKEETDRFYQAVSMWGTDFEMISRMFPARTRKQIKSKWTREDRVNSARLDAAFRKKISVNMDEYAIMANVDLSGPPPEVKVEDAATLAKIKKGEEGGEGEEVVVEGEEEGRSEGGASSSRRGKASQTPDPLAGRQRRGSSVVSSRSAHTAGGGGESSRGGSRRSAGAAELDDRQERERRRRRASSREEGMEGPDEEVLDLPADYA